MHPVTRGSLLRWRTNQIIPAKLSRSRRVAGRFVFLAQCTQGRGVASLPPSPTNTNPAQ
jgi:hypothetical protein